MKDTHALTCPQCGAPIVITPNQSFVLCLYCDTAIRLVDTDKADHSASLSLAEPGLSADIVREVKRLMQNGSRFQAQSRLQQAGLTDEDTRQVIEGYAHQLAVEVLQGQQATPVGWLLMLVLSVIGVGGLIAVWQGLLTPLIGFSIAMLMLMALWPFRKVPATALRYRKAKEAPAEILRLVEISATSKVHIFRALVEVRPVNEPSFQAHMNLPAHKDRLDRLYPGRAFWVKYLNGDPESVLFSRSN